MPEIHYVCLSDLHLGEEDSLLTSVDPDSGSVQPNATAPVLEQLGRLIAHLLEANPQQSRRPVLILNGDILELALATTDVAIKVFARFLQAMSRAGEPLFEELVYVPGNHDHHLWEVARETQYRNYIRRLNSIEELEPAWHTTKLFLNLQQGSPDRVPQASLTAAARSASLREEFEVLTAYPNFGVREENDKAVIFHHGHFVEQAYRLMSTAGSLLFDDYAEPANVYELEGENFAWIDFFWSTMGRSGRMGQRVETIYEASRDERELGRITDTLARNLARRYDLLLRWSNWLEERTLRYLFRNILVRRVAGQHERQLTAQADGMPLSKEAAEGLRWYLSKMVKSQITIEEGAIPRQACFVFGHTHKPFQAIVETGLGEEPTRVFNTGGWVVDAPAERRDQGAAVVLVDEELSVVNLRLYDEGNYQARLEEPLPSGGRHGRLWEQMQSILALGAPVWKEFGETVAREMALRRKLLLGRLSRR